MRIVVNDVAATPSGGGVYSILKDFYDDVITNDKENEWYFLLAGNFFEESDNVHIIEKSDLKRSKVKKVLYELIYGKKEINDLNPDIYISLQNISTIGVKAKKKIAYVHTPVPFQRIKKYSLLKKSEKSLWMYENLVGNVIKKTLKKEQPTVIVQTKWMKKELIRRKILSEENIIVQAPLVEAFQSGKYDGNGTEFFYPTSTFEYKNYQLIYDAVELLHQEGISNFDVEMTLPEDFRKPFQNIRLIGHIDRKDVYKKYTKKVLIFPSYLETFGLPLIEAAIQGDIVLAADTEFGHELLNDYNNVYFFKYDDARELANLMKKVISRDIIANGSIKVQDKSESIYETIMRMIDIN